MKRGLNHEELKRACDESSKRLSKKHAFTVEFYEKDLFLLRRKYQKEHEKARRRFPKLLGEFTDSDIVRYAVYDAARRALRSEVRRHQK